MSEATFASFHLLSLPPGRRAVGGALARVPWERSRLRHLDGLVLGKVLGTGRGEATTLAADLQRWALLCFWEDEAAYDRARLPRRWKGAPGPEGSPEGECWSVRLRPLSSRGTWSGHHLAASGEAPDPDAPIAFVTRATIRLRRLRAFYAAVPVVDADLLARPGRLRSLGMGEWPVAQQGTFSLWSSPAEARAFAYGGTDHKAVIRRTRAEDWYAEELFASFQTSGSEGTWNGVDPLRSPPAPR